MDFENRAWVVHGLAIGSPVNLAVLPGGSVLCSCPNTEGCAQARGEIFRVNAKADSSVVSISGNPFQVVRQKMLGGSP